MLECKSMYHGGELVEAIDVNLDFDSYRELGLVCPFCNEPVFLCGETVRQRKSTGKLTYIQPHFKHFPGGDPVELDCEKRYFTPEGKRYLDAIRSERRGQRLELFNRYFWEMFCDAWQDSSSAHKRRKVIQSKDFRDAGHPITPAHIGAVKRAWSEKKLEIEKMFLDQVSAELTRESHWLHKIDLKIHLLICQEIAMWLTTKKSGIAWESLFWCLNQDNLWEVAKHKPPRWQDIPDYVVGVYVLLISNTNWQQQLEEKAKLKEQTRGKGFALK